MGDYCTIGNQSLLEQNRNLEQETAYIRLVNFGAEAIELELFTYVLIADAARVVREQVLLAETRDAVTKPQA